ncbi:MAG: cytochrome c-type biogenesis protein CcmH [Pseudomonadales bacterium]|nr:cytochrome c-type biogenesis protein CcmH [Pseudomonadales bacterium]
MQVLNSFRTFLAVLISVFLWGVGFSANATIDAYEFTDLDQEERFRQLVAELRCPKCQNQNIADSNAGLAKDIKDRVHLLLQEGKSNNEITVYMVERYGDFITYRPPVRPATWFLWFGPIVIAALVAFFLLIRKLTSKPKQQSVVSPEQQRQVDELMKKLDEE